MYVTTFAGVFSRGKHTLLRVISQQTEKAQWLIPVTRVPATEKSLKLALFRGVSISNHNMTTNISCGVLRCLSSLRFFSCRSSSRSTRKQNCESYTGDNHKNEWKTVQKTSGRPSAMIYTPLIVAIGELDPPHFSFFLRRTRYVVRRHVLNEPRVCVNNPHVCTRLKGYRFSTCVTRRSRNTPP